MKFSVNWLREFVELPPKTADLADLLTMAGVEIEGTEERGANLDKVVVAQINKSDKHPNADKLSVCEVDDGSGTKRQIVCGAKNYKVGDKVPLAQPGAKLPNGLTIKESKLRGVESQGMLCSAIELGLGEEASGLLILDPDAKIGAPISDIFPSDTILDVEITPNRGDLLSHFGLAREIAALTGRKVLMQAPEASAKEKRAGVKLASPNECPFYSARRIENVKVAPSPAWMRAKLEAAGIRAINNIVDISNYVMLEYGQPTHAFDADKLKGDVDVRLARDGEKFLALDGKNYSLTSKDLVIADAERAIGIGGVMGGEETGVSATTKNILLEAAYFTPSAIRRTARTLSLPSDASYRFERGVDPRMILRASERATQLIQEIAGGSPAMDVLIAGEVLANPADVTLAYAKVDTLIGKTISPQETDKALSGFGLQKKKGGTDCATWSIPSHRRDLQRDVDLVEEIMRAHGVQNVQGSDRSRFTATSTADLGHDLETDLRARLVGQGLTEVRTSKLISRKAAAFERAAELKNPLSEDHVALRPSLYAALLEVLARNVNAGAESVRIFEIGRIFLADSASEEKHLGLIFWGDAAGAHWRGQAKRALDYYDLVGAIEALGIPVRFTRGRQSGFPLYVEILSNDQRIGRIVQVPADRSKGAGAVFFAELNVEPIVDAQAATRAFREIERFPAITRDIAMLVSPDLTHEKILRVIENPREPLLESVQLFDLFTAAQENSDANARKSLAYRLTYRERSRTLTSEEVTAAHARVRARLQSELGAELRE